MKAILVGGLVALLVSLFGTRLAVRQFTAWGFGQQIRDDGPISHQSKRGTPTMGGSVLVLSVVLGYIAAKLITWSEPSPSAYLMFLLLIGMGTVGFLDDFIKIRKRRSLGLRSESKMVGQTIVAVVFAILALHPALKKHGIAPVSHQLSFLRDFGPDLAWIVVLALVWLMVNGTSNAANLSDGLDGMLTGCAAMIFGAYVIISIWQNNHLCGSSGVTETICYTVASPLDLGIVAAALAGACFGFLWWNVEPAEIFLGDTGSLALGAAMAGLALLSRTEFLLAVLGAPLVAITISVMLQVSWFKITRRVTGVGKRIFRMAPIQHHFELKGWQQVTVVIRFWITTGLCVVAGLSVFYGEWTVR